MNWWCYLDVRFCFAVLGLYFWVGELGNSFTAICCFIAEVFGLYDFFSLFWSIENIWKISFVNLVLSLFIYEFILPRKNWTMYEDWSFFPYFLKIFSYILNYSSSIRWVPTPSPSPQTSKPTARNTTRKIQALRPLSIFSMNMNWD